MQVWPLKLMFSCIGAARNEAMREYHESGVGMNRWIVYDDPLLWAIKDGDRLNGSHFTGWHGRRNEVVDLLAAYPETQRVVAQGAILVSEDEQSFKAGDYRRFDWEATIWLPTLCAEALWPVCTPWKSAEHALRDTSPNYRPSMSMRDPEMMVLADDYDATATRLGDPRRVYRYGMEGRHPGSAGQGTGELPDGK